MAPPAPQETVLASIPEIDNSLNHEALPNQKDLQPSTNDYTNPNEDQEMVDVEEANGEASWENPAGSEVPQQKGVHTPFFSSKQFAGRDDDLLQEEEVKGANQT